MRKVIPKQDSVAVRLLEDVVSNKYYGVFGYKIKGFITRESFDSGNFYVATSRNITNGNRFCDYYGDNVNAVIEGLLSNNYEVYEFDTANDLFKWLAKD